MDFILDKLTTLVVNNKMKSAVMRLVQLGYSEYEARAYVALLAENPLTAYEIAKKSGIPTSKIYEVIRKLENRGTVQSIHGEGAKMIVPLAPDEFIHGFRSAIEDSLKGLKHDLGDMKDGMERSYTWHIKEYEGLVHKVKRMISTTRLSLLLSTWPPEMTLFSDLLSMAEKRGVQCAIIHYGTPHIKLKQLYIHPTEDTIHAQKGVRGFTIVADGKEALNGTVAPQNTEAIWSMNTGFVMMAESYIRHDIYQMKTIKRFGPALKKVFGEQYEKMRDVYSDDAL